MVGVACAFTNDPPEQIDRIEVRIGGIDNGSAMSVSLQGWINARKGPMIELHCATYAGEWRQASLIALGIEEFDIAP